MKKNLRIFLIAFFSLFLVIASISISYSFFSANITIDESGSTLYAQGATLSITYESADIVFENKIYPREEAWATKTFTVTGDNTSPLKMNYYAGMEVEASDFPDGALTYSLTGSKNDTSSTLITEVTSGTITGGKSKTYFGQGQFVKGSAIHTYILKVYYPDIDTNQNNEQGSTFKAKLFLEQAGTGEIVDKNLDRIEVSTNPTKLNYVKGENFNTSGMVIKAYYTDGTNKTITDYEVVDGTNLKQGQNLVRISYTDNLITRTASVSINVTNNLNKIEIVTPPTKTTYIEGEEFDASNIEVQAVFEDGTKTLIDDYRISNNKYLVKGQTYVTILYTVGEITKTVNQPITVTNDITSIAVSLPPTKTTYIEGATFDKTGMVVVAFYQNGSSKVISNYTITNGTITAGQTSVTISYTDPETSKAFTTTQSIKIGSGLSSLEITTAPNKTVYAPGSNFDPTGMVVKVNYVNGGSKNVTKYTVVNGTNLSASQTEVIISYTESGETITTTQSITMDGKGPTITLTETKTPTSATASGWTTNFKVSGTVSDVSGVSTTKYCTTTSTTCTPTTLTSSATSFNFTMTDTTTAKRYCFQSTDSLGNVSDIKCSTAYKVDSVVPTATAAINSSTQNSAQTWYKALTLKITGSDSGSGVQTIKYCTTSSSTCTPSSTYSSAVTIENSASGIRMCYNATDAAGNTSLTSCTGLYKVDGAAPTLAKATATTTSGNNGWYKAVTVKFTISETQSGLASLKYCTTTSSTCTPSTSYTVSSGTTSFTSYTRSIGNTSTATRVCVQLTDVADNTTSVVCSDAYKVDATNPTVTGSATTGTSGNGWYTSVSYKPSASDTYSGISSMKYCTTTDSTCNPSSTFTIGNSLSLSNGSRACFNATDSAGNTSSTHCSSTYNIDTSSPSATSVSKSGTTISSTGTDNQSGVSHSCLSTSSSSCTSSWTAFSSINSSAKASYTISSAGTYYIHFKDAVGHIKYNTSGATYTCSTSLNTATSVNSRYFANGSVARGWVSGSGTSNYVYAGYNSTDSKNYVGQVQYTISNAACYWKIKFTLAGTDATNANKNIALMLAADDSSSYYNLKGTYGSTEKNWQHASFRIGSSSYGYNGCAMDTVCFNKILNTGTRYGYLYHNSNGSSYDNANSYSSLYVGGAGGSSIQYGIFS